MSWLVQELLPSNDTEEGMGDVAATEHLPDIAEGDESQVSFDQHLQKHQL